MDLDTPVTPVEPIAPPQESDDSSLADHEAAFGKGGVGIETPHAESATGEPETAAEKAERDQSGRFKHRAKSQQAGPADAPRIAELTKKWRDAERRAEEAERRASTRIPETPDRRAAPVEPPKAPAGEKFTFESADDWMARHPELAVAEAYQEWELARLDARDEWRDSRKAAETTKQTQTQAAEQEFSTFQEREQAFRTAHPDYDTVMAASTITVDADLHPALNIAVRKHDKPGEIKYYLAQHPDFFDEMLALTYHQPISDSFVALVQRRLSSRLQAAPTGSAAPLRAPSPAPRPPNPVRTGPMNTGDDLPGDDSSLAEHERAFGKKRSR